MAEKVNPRISKKAIDYYQKHFGSVRRGVTYVLESLPLLADSAWKDIQQVLEPNEVKSLGASLSQWNKAFPLSGLLAIELAPSEAKERMQSLSQFARVLLELEGFGKGSRELADAPPKEVQLSAEVSAECRKFVEAYFPEFTPGCAILLDRFPEWARQAIKEIPRAEANRAIEAMGRDILDNPALAGRLLPMRMVNKVQMGQAKTVPQWPLFTRCALEIEAMTAEKKRKDVQTSPKISSAVSDALAKMFGNNNVGAAFALTIFPRVYEQTLAEEVCGIFTPADLRALATKLQHHDLGNPNTAGDLLLLALEDDKSDLAAKVFTLTPFGRIVLELELLQTLRATDKTD